MPFRNNNLKHTLYVLFTFLMLVGAVVAQAEDSSEDEDRPDPQPPAWNWPAWKNVPRDMRTRALLQQHIQEAKPELFAFSDPEDPKALIVTDTRDGRVYTIKDFSRDYPFAQTTPRETASSEDADSDSENPNAMQHMWR